MVLESTIICVDNSDFMRNGDFLPTRLQAQRDAVNLVCHSKTRSNPENNVGLLTLANVEVLATMTSDVGRILSKLHEVQPNGNINFHVGIRTAHLVLKHRQGKNHKMRIVAFIGSPVETDENDLVKLAKKLKKEKVNVDIVSFGEGDKNSSVLTAFVNTLNGKDGTSSHLVTIPPGPHLSDALISSPIIQGEDGTGGAGLSTAGFEFGVDPNEDPELALALRVSMEEQRQRQEDEARRTQASAAAQQSGVEGSVTESGSTVDNNVANVGEITNEEALLERALAMSMDVQGGESIEDTEKIAVDFANMTEDEQIAFAMRMSMQDAQPSPLATTSGGGNQAMASDADKKPAEAMEVDRTEDCAEVMNDPTFLQSVLENLPGVDPQSEAVRQAVASLQDKKSSTTKKEDKEKK